jgi:hypothetical protein
MDVSGLPVKAGYVESGRLYRKYGTFHFFISNQSFITAMQEQTAYCNLLINTYTISR